MCCTQLNEEPAVGRASERSIARYLQSLNEYYNEDAVLDLALAVESLVGTGEHMGSYRFAVLAGCRKNMPSLCKAITDLFHLRNSIAHGAPAKDRIDVEKTRLIVRAGLLAYPFVAVSHKEWMKKKKDDQVSSLRNLLDSWVVSCDEQEKSRKFIPPWVFDN